MHLPSALRSVDRFDARRRRREERKHEVFPLNIENWTGSKVPLALTLGNGTS